MPTFVAVSGLPGTGKSSLAEGLRLHLGWKVLAIDDVAELMARSKEESDVSFWDRATLELLEQVRVALRCGESVIVDHVFMNRDRFHAAAIAEDAKAVMKPIHTLVSDVGVWRTRVEARHLEASELDVATWDQVVKQRAHFREWDPDTAIFLDAVRPFEENLEDAIEYVASERLPLRDLPTKPYTPGDYHRTHDDDVARSAGAIAPRRPSNEVGRQRPARAHRTRASNCDDV